MGRFKRQMDLQGCQIWTQNLSQLVDVTSFNMNWNLLGIIECLLVQWLPVLVACGTFLIFYLTILELICWQAELQNQLLYLIEFKSLIERSSHFRTHDHSDFLCSHSLSAEQQTVFMYADVSMGRFRQEFIRCNSLLANLVKTNLIYTKNYSSGGSISHSKLDSRRAFQSLGFETLELIHSSGQNVNPNEVYMLMSERIYVNFCLYLEYFNHNVPSLAAVVTLGYLLLYGLIIISVWYCNTISGGQFDGPLLTVAFVWLLVNFLLFISSVIHARVSRIVFSI